MEVWLVSSCLFLVLSWVPAQLRRPARLGTASISSDPEWELALCPHCCSPRTSPLVLTEGPREGPARGQGDVPKEDICLVGREGPELVTLPGRRHFPVGTEAGSPCLHPEPNEGLERGPMNDH